MSASDSIPDLSESWWRSLKNSRARQRVAAALQGGAVDRALGLIKRWEKQGGGAEAERWRYQALVEAGRWEEAWKWAKRCRKTDGPSWRTRESAALKKMAAAALAAGRVVPLEGLEGVERHVPGVTELDGRALHFSDGPSVHAAWREIYGQRIYDFAADGAPRIIDGGANVGLATLRMKRLFPQARLTCVEADPTVADCLRKNLEAAGHADVEVLQAALWEHAEGISFAREGSDAGHVEEGGADSERVPSVTLSSLLKEPVDLLKLDIEGAERVVLREAAPHLHRVQRLFVEYHSYAGQTQDLPELLVLLRDAGFRISLLMPDAISPRPFEEVRTSVGMDLRVNVFGTRK